MRTCPVCERECDTMVCSRCGFDGSRNYERFPTIAAIAAPVDSLAKRKEALVIPAPKPKRRRWVLPLSVAAACLLIVLAVLLYHPWNGWFERFGKTYYYEDGHKADGFTQIGGDTYYFGYDGVMRTGRVLIHGEDYYFSSDGVMQTGWQQPYPDLDYKSDVWFYYGDDGIRQHYWITVDGKTYWLDYYDGRVTGLQTIDGNVYYFDENGILQTDCSMTIDGVDYYFDENGVYSGKTISQEEPEKEDAPVLDTEPTEEVTQPATEETKAPDPTTPPTTPPATTPPATTPPATTPTEPEPTETDPAGENQCIFCDGKGERTCYCVEWGHGGLCSVCYGTGVYQMVSDSETQETITILCYNCGGNKVCTLCYGAITVECDNCDGSGYWP